MRHFLEAKKLRQRDAEGLNMNKPMTDTVETRDLYLASLWYAKGLLMENVRHEGKQCYFIFRDTDVAKELERRYFSKEELVNAKDFVNAVKTLKELIFR